VALRLLFHPPFPEPYVQVSKHTALQWPDSQEVGSWYLTYLAPLVPVRLSPFAMCPAFPDSDYYGDSVAIGLAPRRRS
jgi:hypothetical protein